MDLLQLPLPRGDLPVAWESPPEVLSCLLQCTAVWCWSGRG